MKQITFERVLAMSGIDSSDSEFEQDIKFLQWMGSRKYQIISPATNESQPDSIGSEVEILIIKE